MNLSIEGEDLDTKRQEYNVGKLWDFLVIYLVKISYFLDYLQLLDYIQLIISGQGS